MQVPAQVPVCRRCTGTCAGIFTACADLRRYFFEKKIRNQHDPAQVPVGRYLRRYRCRHPRRHLRRHRHRSAYTRTCAGTGGQVPAPAPVGFFFQIFSEKTCAGLHSLCRFLEVQAIVLTCAGTGAKPPVFCVNLHP